MQKASVLVVEDDSQIRRFLKVGLESSGYNYLESALGKEGLGEVAKQNPEIVILDLGLPDLDGLEFLRVLRELSQVPVLVLTARDREKDKIEALDQGADDYLTKPFSLNELLARVRVALRRAEEIGRLRSSVTGKEPQRSIYRCGGENGLIVDFAHRAVRSGGREVHLTPIEYDLLCELTRNSGKVLTHRELLQRVWGPDYSAENTYLRTFIRHLRRKLEPDPSQPRFLLNELGVGYYVPPADVDTSALTS